MNSELRQDLVSGDWVAISPKRAVKHLQNLKKTKRIKLPIKNCPFENPQKSGNGKPFLIYQNFKDWEIQVISNKYPAFSPKMGLAKKIKSGPYSVVEGVGYHDLLITRDHNKNFSALGVKEANLVFFALKERYGAIAKDKNSAYISIFPQLGAKGGRYNISPSLSDNFHSRCPAGCEPFT